MGLASAYLEDMGLVGDTNAHAFHLVNRRLEFLRVESGLMVNETVKEDSVAGPEGNFAVT